MEDMELDELERRAAHIRACEELLRDWIADPSVCMAVAKSCIQVGECRCLYCRTKKLVL